MKGTSPYSLTKQKTKKSVFDTKTSPALNLEIKLIYCLPETKIWILESDIDSNPCSSEADDEIASRVDDELTFEYTVDGDVDIGSYLNSLPKMKDAKMINDCPLIYQIESPKPSSIIATSVATNKIATNGENLGKAPNRSSYQSELWTWKWIFGT